MKTSNLIWGIVLVILGFIFGLNALEITNINLFFKGWWTLFIIVPCLIGLYNGKDITGNAIGVIIGLFLLLICQGIVDLTILFKLFIPIVLVVIGLTLIFKDKLNDKLRKEGLILVKEAEKTNNIDKYYEALTMVDYALHDGHAGVSFLDPDHDYTVENIKKFNNS